MSGRLCVVGNSHVACVKLAHAEGGAPGLRPEGGAPGLGPVDFFAASANRMASLRVADGGRLVADDARAERQMRAVAAGRDGIELAAYDAFALVGIGFEHRDFVRLARTHCLGAHRAWRGGRDLIGDAAFRAWLASLQDYRPAYRLARAIAAARPGAAVLVVASPSPTVEALEGKPMRALRGLLDTPYFDALARLHAACAAAAAAAAGAVFVPQSPDTLARPGFTDPRFNARPVGLRAPAAARPGDWHAEKTGPDPWHMNVDFGRRRLADLAAALARARVAA